jgi:DNA-binding protein HU-beta
MVERMKKFEMIEDLATKTGLTKNECEKVFNATFEIFKDELAKGEKVSVAGFGTFKITERAARDGRNPLTGEKIKIKASKSVNFKLSTAIKDKIN